MSITRTSIQIPFNNISQHCCCDLLWNYILVTPYASGVVRPGNKQLERFYCIYNYVFQFFKYFYVTIFCCCYLLWNYIVLTPYATNVVRPGSKQLERFYCIYNYVFQFFNFFYVAIFCCCYLLWNYIVLTPFATSVEDGACSNGGRVAGAGGDLLWQTRVWVAVLGAC